MSRAKGRRVMSTPESAAAGKGEDFEDRKFYAAFDGLVGRPEGFYLDMKERHDAETVRAKMEGREPNHDEGALPAAVGTQLRLENDRPENRWYSNPAILAMEDKDVDPVSTLEVSVATAAPRVDLGHAAQVARERKAQDEALASADTDSDVADTAEQSEVNDELTGANFNSRDTTV